MKTSNIITASILAAAMASGTVTAENVYLINKERRVAFGADVENIGRVEYQNNNTTLSVYDNKEQNVFSAPIADMNKLAGKDALWATIGYGSYFPYAILNTSMGADVWQRIINLGTDHYAQYFVCEAKYENQKCQVNDDWLVWFWDSYYTSVNELDHLFAEDAKTPENVKTAARVWRVWIMSRLTDYFGDVPYFNPPIVGAENPGRTVFDRQEDIYKDMLKVLAEASDSFAEEAAAEFGCYPDPLFNGDVQLWRQFANTMRLRLAMRLTEVAPDLAKEHVEGAFAAKGGLVTEDVTLWKARNYYCNDFSFNLFYPLPHYWSKALAMSESMEKILTNLGGHKVVQPANRSKEANTWNSDSVPEYVDPRGLIMFDVTSAGTFASYIRHREKDPNTGKNVWVIDNDFRGRWSGIRAGLGDEDAQKAWNNCVNNSRLGAFYVTPGRPEPYLTSSDTPSDTELWNSEARDQVLLYANEVDFLLAEACLRGYVDGDAKAYYESGIRKAMQVFNRDKTLIDEATISSYLASDMENLMGTSVAFDDCEGEDLSGNHNSKLYKVMTQKYLAGFPENSYEAWNDYRRLGMPALDPMAAPADGAVLEKGAYDWKGSLRRFTYPEKVKKADAESYSELLNRIGADATSTRMWWDARTTVVE